MKNKKIKLKGNLDIFVIRHEKEDDYEEWDEVLIHGDPKGLKSLAKLLIQMAEINQESIDDKVLPFDTRQHIHLTNGYHLSKSSVNVIIGRLDAKGTGEFYDRYIQKDIKK